MTDAAEVVETTAAPEGDLTLDDLEHSVHAAELDGDSFGKAVGLGTWVEPRGLRIRVPSEAA